MSLTFHHNHDNQVDVIFGGENIGISNYDDVIRIDDGPYYCAKAGGSMMARKDMVHKFGWFDEGLAKLRDNGDYDWLCNINSNGKFWWHWVELPFQFGDRF